MMENDSEVSSVASYQTQDTVTAPRIKIEPKSFEKSFLGAKKMYEIIDVKCLKQIYRYYDKLEHLFQNDDNDNGRKESDFEYNLRLILHKILQNIGDNDYITVTYKKSKKSKKINKRGTGRWYCENGVGVQFVSRKVRHMICQDLYLDIDIVNCHPTIFAMMCSLYGLEHSYLNEYITNRDGILDEIVSVGNCNRDEAKVRILTVMFGGGSADSIGTEWGSHFYFEFLHNTAVLFQLSDLSEMRKHVENTDNSLGKFLSLVSNYIENELLETLFNVFVQDGIIPKFNDGYQCCLVFDGIQVLDNEANRGKLMENGLEYYEKILSEKYNYPFYLKIKPMDDLFDISDYIYTPNDLTNLNLNTLSDLQKLPYHEVKTVFERYIVKIKNPIIYIEFTDDEVVTRKKDALKDVYANVKFQRFDAAKNYNKLMPFLPAWFSDASIKTYERMDFLPPPCLVPGNVCNVWRGFDILKVALPDNFDMDNNTYVNRFIDHMKALFDDQDLVNYVTSWLAAKIQRPGNKTCVCIQMYSNDEGTGKNALCDAIRKVFGDSYSIELDDVKEGLFGKHSKSEFHKLICVVSECKGKDVMSDFDKFKNKVTATSATFEPKGVDRFECKVFCDFIFTTNNYYMPSSDRRICYIEVTNKLLGNVEYFRNFYEDIVNNPIAIRCIFEYLYRFDYTKYVVGSNFQISCPQTEYQVELRGLNRAIELDLLEYLITDRIVFSILKEASDDSNFIKVFKTNPPRRNINTLYDFLKLYKNKFGGSNSMIPTVKTFNTYFNQNVVKKINRTEGYEGTIKEGKSGASYYYIIDVMRACRFLGIDPVDFVEEDDEDSYD
eukprot:765562-Hanusia_phi.AAC.1